MREEFPLLYCIMMFVLVTSPFTFLVGLFLLLDVNTYLKIEKFLNKTYGATKSRWRNKWLQSLEKDRESLQIFLFERRRFLGIVCLLQSFGVFIINFILMGRL